MQEDQQRAWEGQKREQEAKTVSQETQTSVAEIQTVAGTSSTGNVPSTSQFHFPSSGPGDEMEAGREEETQVNIDSFHIGGNLRRRAERSLSENSGTVPSIFAAASAASYREPSDVDIGEPSEPPMSVTASMRSDRSRSDKPVKNEKPFKKKRKTKTHL